MMKFTSVFLMIFLGVFLGACSKQEPASQELYQAVDALYDSVLAGAEAYELIAEIDHSRLAAEEGEVMPPARVIIFSDPAVNTAILQREPLAGLDLPFRVLAYAEGESAAVIFTSADYLKRRYGLTDGPDLQQYGEAISAVVDSLPDGAIVPFDTSSLTQGAGIVTLSSNYGFEQSIDRLKTNILSEDDTTWFGEIDYQAEAAARGVELPGLTLLLFGAPGPGAKAMVDIPRMGLDAFCQKALVHELPDGSVRVYFNEMPIFAELHQGSKNIPHRIINYRMGKTLSGAIEE
ncbi:DUF302 domain-containing protein [Pseudomonadota bacterium]